MDVEDGAARKAARHQRETKVGEDCGRKRRALGDGHGVKAAVRVQAALQRQRKDPGEDDAEQDEADERGWLAEGAQQAAHLVPRETQDGAPSAAHRALCLLARCHLEDLVERYRVLGIEDESPLNAITEQTRAALERE
ncbi:MAG: hypothetical protein ABR562_03010, partial [Thermoplasmatota archaeon]